MRQVLMFLGALLFACAPAWAQAGMSGQDKPAPKEEPRKEEPKETKEEKKEKQDKADTLKAYRTKGNTWTHKHTAKYGSMEESISYVRYEVTDVTDTKATVKQSNLDKDEKEISNNTFDVTLKVEEANAPAKDAVKDTPKDEAKISEEKITVGAGEFTCVKRETESAGTKSATWTDKATHLLVKMVVSSDSGSSTTELVKAQIK